jgi:precorrin-6B methylase 2
MIAQTLAAILTVVFADLLAPLGVVLPPFGAALLTGVFAVAFSRTFAMERWWLPMQFLFTPLVFVVASLQLPSVVWILLFAVLVAVYWSTYRTQVPLYLSSTKVRQALIPLLPAGPFTFMDVGSGVGGVLIDLAAARHDGEYHGVESAPVPWLISWLRFAFGRHANCHAHWGSLWKTDLRAYDVVFAYLSPVPMAALWEKVQREMRPGTRFISNTFAVDATQPAQTVQVDDLHNSTLFVWVIA